MPLPRSRRGALGRAAHRPPGKAHRADRRATAALLAGTDSPASPFARLNQDCVDAVVEYAADSMRAALALRGVSWGLCRGVSALVRCLCRAASPQSPAVLADRAVDAVAAHLGQQPRLRRSAWLAAATLALVALVPQPTRLHPRHGEVTTAFLRRVGAAAGPRLEELDIFFAGGVFA